MDDNSDIEDVGPDMSVYDWGDGPAPAPDRTVVAGDDDFNSCIPPSPLVLPSPSPSPVPVPAPVSVPVPVPGLGLGLSSSPDPSHSTPQPPSPDPQSTPSKSPKPGIWSSLRARYSISRPAAPQTTDRSLGAPSGPYNSPPTQFSPPAVSFYPPPSGFPPPVFNPPPQITCDGCASNLTDRPRIHCIECPDYDLCSRCYHERTITRGHQLWHSQQTLHPNRPIERKIKSSRAVYTCGVCVNDLTGDIRVKCLDCREGYDLCLDCNLMGATSGHHSTTHRTSFINDNSTPARLMGKDGEPSEVLVRMIEGMFDYIDSAYRPKNTGLLEPEKLSAFYRKMGVADTENIGLFSDEKIAFQYSSMRCQFMFISAKHEEISSRATPWTIDALDTQPKTPVLTKLGWMRFFVVCAWRAPTTMHYLLQHAINTGYIRDSRRKTSADPFFKPSNIPRSAFPGRPLHLGEQAIKT